LNSHVHRPVDRQANYAENLLSEQNYNLKSEHTKTLTFDLKPIRNQQDESKF